MESAKQIDTSTLRGWLENGKEVSVLDIRPIHERTEWFIPGSVYFNAYDKLKAGDTAALQGLHLDKTVPVVTICGGGKTSLIAAGILRQQGFEAYSLQGGMKAWSLAWNTARITFPGFDIIQFRRTGKGCLSYLIVSNNEAVAIDASLPIEAYEQALKKRGLTLKHVMETHIHADHLSRSKQLAENNNLTLQLPAPNKVIFAFEPVTAATELKVGNITVKAVHTPGHTLESTSYLVDGKVLITGDTLFIDSVGRPDLKASAEEANQRAKLLYWSLQKLLSFNDEIIVLPGHSSQPVDFNNIAVQATISSIKNNVPILQLSESDFVNTILQRIPPSPANYRSIVEKNITGDFSVLDAADLEAGANRCAIS